mgnify:CR=1 FL=1
MVHRRAMNARVNKIQATHHGRPQALQSRPRHAHAYERARSLITANPASRILARARNKTSNRAAVTC